MNAYQWNQLIIWNEETNLNVRKFVATCDSGSQCQQQQKVQHSTLLLYYITHISIHTRTPRDATIILFRQQQRQQHHHHHPPPPHHDSGTCRSYHGPLIQLHPALSLLLPPPTTNLSLSSYYYSIALDNSPPPLSSSSSSPLPPTSIKLQQPTLMSTISSCHYYIHIMPISSSLLTLIFLLHSLLILCNSLLSLLSICMNIIYVRYRAILLF